jgi:hypothetical protein
MLCYATGVLFNAHESQGKNKKNINDRERTHANNGDFVNMEFSHAWRLSMLSEKSQLKIIGVSSVRQTVRE